MADDLKTKLPADLKAQWVEALRSGKYRQGDRYLFKADSYCCIGVLCVVSGQSQKDIEGASCLRSYEALASMLDPGCDRRIQVMLENMNDGVNVPKRSFKEIADWVEASL